MASPRVVASSVLFALAVACGGDDLVQPDPTVDPDSDLTHEEAERVARMGTGAKVIVNGQEVAAWDLPAHVVARDLILQDCLTTLQKSPGGLPFMNVAGPAPTPMAGCTYDSMVLSGQFVSSEGVPSFFSPPAITDANACHITVCRVEADLCVAQRLRELATNVAPMTVRASVNTATLTPQFSVAGTTVADVVLPPPDVETRVALEEMAFHYASQAATTAGENLRKAGGRATTDGRCTATQLTYSYSSGTSAWIAGDSLASAFSEAVIVADEAARAAAAANQAVAQGDVARFVDRAAASKAAWSSGSMSRARAAHLLLGGMLTSGLADYRLDLGMNPSTITNSAATCSADPPEGSSEKAQEILQVAAANPLLVSNLGVNFTTLFETGSAVVGQSDVPLRNRLAERLGDPSIATMSASAFLARQGLSETDFLSARAYTAQRNKLFARDATKLAPAMQLASTQNADGSLSAKNTTYPIYAASSREADPAPAGHYRTMARFVPDRFQSNIDSYVYLSLFDGLPGTYGVTTPSTTYARNSLAGLLDYSRTVSAELVQVVPGPTTLSSTVVNVMATYLGAEGSKVSGRFESCYRYDDVGTGRPEFRLRVYGSSASVDHVIVVGASGLRCALDGAVEGEKCNLSDYAVTTTGATVLAPFAAATVNANEKQAGFRDYVETTIQPGTLTLGSLPYVYVVRKRAGMQPLPGSYELVGGLRFIPSTNVTLSATYQYCTLQPIQPDVWNEADETLTPSEENCAQPQMECVGKNWFEKIPLESELSDDGNGIESSWRVYLDRARQAADRADQLGEQLIEAGLDIDRRIETSVEELENYCGEGVSLSDYFPGDMSGYRGGPCSAGQEGQSCGTPLGTVCRAGTCVADPLTILKSKAATDPAAAKLLECLGADSLINVSVGSRPMCAWIGPTGPMCEPFTNSPECPYASADGLTCTAALPAGYTALPIIKEPDLLHMFPPPEDAPPDGAAPPVCSKVRQLRDPSVRGEQRKALMREVSGFFQPGILQPYASRVGWEARPDDYSAITIDGVPRWSTGSIQVAAPATPTWPCVQPATVDKAYLGRENKALACPANPAAGSELNPSLFCASTQECAATVDPVKRARRARFNERMGRAVVALRILAGAGIGPSVRGPYLPAVDYVDADADSWDGEDWSHDRRWPQGNTAVTLPDGRSAAVAGTIEYRSIEYDLYPNGDDVGSVIVDGLALCYNTGSQAIWTALGGSLANTADLGSLYSASCASSNWHASFKSYPSSAGDEPGSVIGRIWNGLDGHSVVYGDRWDGLVAKTVLSPDVPGDTVIVQPFEQGTDDLTNFWMDESYGLGILLRSSQNVIGISRDGLRERDVLDAMELACEVARLDVARADTCGLEPPTPDSVQDLGVVADYMQCQASKIRKRAEQDIFLGVPQTALDAFKPGFQLDGERGAAAGRFAAALTRLRDHELALTSAMRSYASDVQSLNIQLQKHGISRELIEINKAAAVAQNMAACAGAIAGALSPKVSNWGAAAVCMNSVTQIDLALQAASAQFDGVELDEGQTWVDFRARLASSLDLMQRASIDLEASGTELRAALADLETLRQKGLRDLARAMMLGTDAAGRHFNVNTVIRRRYNTLLVRYQRALEDGRKMAWLARRAVEQRLGIKLLELGDMTLVDAPSSWADSLCELGGVDYTRIRQENGLDGDDYADEYLGDYVRKLDLVVASYEHDFPFHEGQDTAVVSLRDDVKGVRDICVTSVPNMLAYSGRLDVATYPTDGEAIAYESTIDGISPPPPELVAQPVWSGKNCNVNPADGQPLPDCVRVDKLDASLPANRPFLDSPDALGDVNAFKITFGPGGATGWTSWPSSTAPTVFGQKVTLDRGWYRLSYMSRAEPGAYPANGLVKLVSASNVKSSPASNGPGSEAVNPTWTRYFTMSYVDTPGDYYVAVLPPPTATVGNQFTVVAAIMLEDISGQVLSGAAPGTIDPNEFKPVQFVSTEEAGEALDAVCEDTDGSVFRTLWTRGCEQLCADGFGSCPGQPEACYWEIELPISLEDTESGSFLANAGFAHGNYNYRLDTLAVNFVGTGLKDCSTSSLPSTCQANASVPFSLEHVGPFPVRNHGGGDYLAPLFVGHIEHGRGLAAERYLTNPISSGDRTLIEPYTHVELRGRPLTGTYRLRVWDVDGLVLNRLEDVQVVLGYRYWTRFGE